MPRMARVVVPGWPHHVTQRGNNRQDVFFDDEDRQHYLRFLAEQARRFGLDILGYCLMTNHVHLIAIPQSHSALARAVGRAHWLYSQHINRSHRRSGHLWQNRFHSCPMEQPHLLAATAYVELNPLRAGIAADPSGYPWSSARAHITGEDPAGILNLDLFRQYSPGLDWAGFLHDRNHPSRMKLLQLHTIQGKPLAEGRVLKRLETKVGRPLNLASAGRPMKIKVN